MTQYFLGVDIGATKSHALIADEAGQALGLGVGGPGNYEVIGEQGLRDTLNAITDLALENAGVSKEQVAGAGFGIGGYDWPSEKELTRRAIETLGLSAPFGFVNDATIGLIAGASQGWGVAVVAGTSCNARGRDRSGREAKITGAGPWMGEYGGASEIVAKAVQSVSKAWSMRGPATYLADTFVRYTGAQSTEDLLEGLILQRYQLRSTAAPLVFQVAAEGDEVAQEIVHWAGRELGGLANGIIRQLGFEKLEFEVVLAGSLFKGGPALIETMMATIQAVAPKARLVRLNAPPVVGAVFLGMEQAGVEFGSIRQTLIDTTNGLLARQQGVD